jgi:hypothetical protein
VQITLSSPDHNVTFVLVASSTSLIDYMCQCHFEIFIVMYELLYPQAFESDNFVVEYMSVSAL